MKFITLTDANQETRKYTINVNDIACIETYVNDGIDGGTVYVKETAEQILNALERQQTVEKHLKNVVR